MREIAHLFNLIGVSEFRACECKQELDESALDRVLALNVLHDLFNRFVEFLELNERSSLVELFKDTECFLCMFLYEIICIFKKICIKEGKMRI